MPDILPLADAVAKLDAKTPLGALLTSADWEQVPLALRERAQFSAGVTSARVLQAIQDRLSAELKQQRENVGDGRTAVFDRSSFINSVRQIAIDEGLTPVPEEHRGTVRDITSIPRLGLIYDMQKAMASGYANHKFGMSEGALDTYPGYRLTESTAAEPRPQIWWERRWAEAGAAVNWQGAIPGEFVALKTSPIWARLSRFGTPWPPFDWGSTREVEDVDRAEAVALGLLREQDVLGDHETDFNAGLQASVSGLTPASVEQLKKFFGQAADFVGDVVKWATGN